MPPRAVKWPSTASALKKKSRAKTPVETKEEPREVETLQNNTNHSTVSEKNEEHIEPFPTPKEGKEENDVTIGYHEVDRSERLELEDNYPHFEAEDYGGTQMGMEGEEEEHYEGKIDGDHMMEDVMEGEGEEDGHAEEVDGEEEEEHHDVAKERQERRKCKEFEVFVGGLDRDATEEDLRKVFIQVGEVTEVRLMMNPMTHKNKGFAFIRFATVEQARRAINELKHPTVNGKQCGVSPSQDSDTLFVGNICKTWTKEALKEKLSLYGVDSFEDLTLVEDSKNEGMNRGFAFLDFPSRADALDACKRLQRMDVVFGTDRTAKVAFADTFIEPDDEIMSQVKTIFIDGLPPAWDEDRVREPLKKYGKIEKVELARNMPAAKRTDFGFVTFDTHDSAVACVEGINNTELHDGDKKVKVRARLSRPRQRGKSAKHARGGYLVGHSGHRGGRAWSSSMPRMDSWRFAGRSERVTQSRNSYGGGYKRPFDPRDRHPPVDIIPERVGDRRRMPSLPRSYDRRSPGPAYGKRSSRRDYMWHDEPLPRSSDNTRAHSERQSSYRDAYPSRGPRYPYSPPRSTSHGAARRPPPLYAEESYGRPVERPSSYRDSNSRDYSSISGSKRPHSAMEELHPQYTESTVRQSRARYEYEGSSAAMSYNDSAYGGESTRMGRGSHLGYDGGSRSSAGHSHGLYDSRTSRMGYSRDEASRGDAGGMYSSYGRDYVSRDYISTEEDVDAGSYSSLYSNRRMSDGYLSGRGSGSYY
ncbi:heterogeneous nuclear ribonucleoprotein R-like isoform X2 [Telopea speciosissima]|uniref:heterogeneous nuclear ribonucleoprotein R-like isoform X2 n=1 Tax=Telopea speciosissima TaxID=54955 RepID=UPI001CC5C0E5|nr:heterogeneous nuclear ribonucleoprotein R-like isoform X2 [Telopea speciosissima]